MNKRVAYKVKENGLLLNSKSMIHMRQVAFTPINLKTSLSEEAEILKINKAFAKREMRAAKYKEIKERTSKS